MARKAEPYRIKMVEYMRVITREERLIKLQLPVIPREDNRFPWRISGGSENCGQIFLKDRH